MINIKNKKIVIIILTLILFLALIYLAIFGRALKQPENHVRMAFALPKAVFTSEAVEIGNNIYLSKSSDSFINEMKKQGFSYVEQLGAGYVFEKEEKKYVSTSRMYSFYFKIFTQPIEINDY